MNILRYNMMFLVFGMLLGLLLSTLLPSLATWLFVDQVFMPEISMSYLGIVSIG